MARKAEPVSRRISAVDSSKGFTLIESLVALAILGVIVAVLVHVHLQSLRAEEFSRLRAGAVLQAETILTGSMLAGDGGAGWREGNADVHRMARRRFQSQCPVRFDVATGCHKWRDAVPGVRLRPKDKMR